MIKCNERVRVTSSFFGTNDEFQSVDKNIHQIDKEVQENLNKIKDIHTHIEEVDIPLVTTAVEEAKQVNASSKQIKSEIDAIKKEIDSSTEQYFTELEDFKTNTIRETTAIKDATQELHDNVQIIEANVEAMEQQILEDRTATENARDIAIDAKEVTIKTKDQAIIDMNSIKKEVNDLSFMASNAAEKAKESEIEATNQAKLSKQYADKSEAVYNDFMKDMVYRGMWNPQETPEYPDPQGTNSVWDVVLNPDTESYPNKGVTWHAGDRLIYSKPNSKYLHIKRITGVSSVNGKTGAVTLRAQDVNALSVDGGFVHGDISIFNRTTMSHTGVHVLANNPAITLTDLDAEAGVSANTIIGSEGNARDSLYVITPVDPTRRKVYHEGNKPTWADVGGDNYFTTASNDKGQTMRLSTSYPSMQLGDGTNPGFYPPAHKKGSIGAKGFTFNHIWGDTLHGSQVLDSGKRVWSEANKPTTTDLGVYSTSEIDTKIEGLETKIAEVTANTLGLYKPLQWKFDVSEPIQSFTVAQYPNMQDADVFINGVRQRKDEAFSIQGNVITLAEMLEEGDVVDVVVRDTPQGGIPVLAENTEEPISITKELRNITERVDTLELLQSKVQTLELLVQQLLIKHY